MRDRLKKCHGLTRLLGIADAKWNGQCLGIVCQSPVEVKQLQSWLFKDILIRRAVDAIELIDPFV